MKTFKQFFYENKEYQVDDTQQEEYLEYQSEFVYDYEAMMGLPSGGEKGKMYHWCANMKGGKNK